MVLDAGLAHIGIGVQSGCESFLLKYYSRHQQYDTMLTFAQMMFDNFISCSSQFIAGNCYETEEAFLETIDFIRKLPFSIKQPNLHDIYIPRLRPHPKSPITKISPRVVTDPMPIKDWLYRASFMYLANKIPEDDINELMAFNLFKCDPNKILDFCRSYISKKQREHFEVLVYSTEDKTGFSMVLDKIICVTANSFIN